MFCIRRNSPKRCGCSRKIWMLERKVCLDAFRFFHRKSWLFFSIIRNKISRACFQCFCNGSHINFTGTHCNSRKHDIKSCPFHSTTYLCLKKNQNLYCSLMYVPLLVSYLVLASGLVHAFGGGWVPFAQNVLQGRQAEAWTPRSRDAVNAAALRLPQRSVPRSRFRAHPNEYEAFFNKACKSGVAVMNKLSPEERAQRALEVSTVNNDALDAKLRQAAEYLGKVVFNARRKHVYKH